MNDIAELERRISAALARIGAALEALPRDVRPDPDAPALSEALETERAANAQLTERVRAIKEKQEIVVTALEKKVAQLTRQLDAATRDLARQRSANVDLLETNRMLNDAARGTLTTPELVNAAMESELSALRAARAADLAEMEEIMAELKPLIGEVA